MSRIGDPVPRAGVGRRRFVPGSVLHRHADVLTGYVCEEDAICLHRLLPRADILGKPCRRKFPFPGLLFQSESCDPAACGAAQLDRRVKTRAYRPVEGDRQPAVTLRVLPERHRTPDPLCCVIRVVVANQWRAIERRPVVVAAEFIAIQQPDATLLTRPRNKMPALMVERHRTDVDVEIPLP